MFKKSFLLLFLFQSITLLSAEDVYLYIDNFDASGETVTFDIMMDNKVPVYGAQLDIMSGDGEYNGAADCKCVDGEVPDGCTECYFDFGPDYLKSNYEKDGAGTEYDTSVKIMCCP